jgi:hypothetical protein
MAMDIIKKTLSGNGVGNPYKYAAGLSAVWQNHLSKLHGPDCRMLIPKEHGQLRRLKESLGMNTATEVVEYAIQNWGTFGRKAAENVGSSTFPPKPCVGWLLKYQATAVTMLHGELQSIAKKQAEEEQAKKEGQAKEAAKSLQELKAKEPSTTLLLLTKEQANAFFYMLEDPANEAWADSVTEKYGDWRPANKTEKGIPCDIEFKKAS